MPIGRPSTAVKPIVLATLRPPTIAHMLLPLPRCATTVRPAAAFGIELRQHAGDVLVGQAVEAVAPHAALGDRRRQREGLRHLGLGAMEGGVEAGDLRQVGAKLRRRSRSASGCAAGAAAPAGSAWRARRSPRASTRTACVKSRPPCTTRWPTATSWLSPRLLAQELDQVGDRAVVPELGALVPGLRAELARLARPWRRIAAPCRCLRSGPCSSSGSCVAAGVEDAELEARRAGVEDEDHVGHGVTPRPWRPRGAPWRPAPRRRRRRAGSAPNRPGWSG